MALNNLKKLEQAKCTLNGMLSRFETEQSQLKARKESLNKELQQLLRKRQVILTSIAPDLFARYEELRKRKNGLAVAIVENNSCSACGTQLTPSERQEIHRSAKLFLCPVCGRILYPR